MIKFSPEVMTALSHYSECLQLVEATQSAHCSVTYYRSESPSAELTKEAFEIAKKALIKSEVHLKTLLLKEASCPPT